MLLTERPNISAILRPLSTGLKSALHPTELLQAMEVSEGNSKGCPNKGPVEWEMGILPCISPGKFPIPDVSQQALLAA